MKRATRLIMGMPITIQVVDALSMRPLNAAFDLFRKVDARFSPFKPGSEVCRYERAEINDGELSADMREVLDIAAATMRQTNGYFDIRRPDGRLDPSGIVKGWAIRSAAEQLRAQGFRDFCIEAGGDIQTAGRNPYGGSWRVGIRNPFDDSEIVKVIEPCGRGVATSGTYARGDHIYDPKAPGRPGGALVSLTVVADDILEADRFATAAFAMGSDGIQFIENRPALEGYAIDPNGIATFTSGFGAFVR